MSVKVRAEIVNYYHDRIVDYNCDFPAPSRSRRYALYTKYCYSPATMMFRKLFSQYIPYKAISFTVHNALMSMIYVSHKRNVTVPVDFLPFKLQIAIPFPILRSQVNFSLSRTFIVFGKAGIYSSVLVGQSTLWCAQDKYT